MTTIDDRPLPAILRNRGLGIAMILLGAVGWFASFGLTIEFIHKLQEPDAQLLCDVSPFVTCGPAMLSSAAHLFGFPNVIIGLTAFTVVITTGVVLVAGLKLPRWYWIGLQIGVIGAAALITYLQIFSVFELAKLCMWCMIIWSITIPLATLVTIGAMVRGTYGDGAQRVGRTLADWWWVIVLLWYLAVIVMIFLGMGSAFQLT